MCMIRKLKQIFSDSADNKLAPTHANVDCSEWCQHCNNSLANQDKIDIHTVSKHMVSIRYFPTILAF